MSLLLFFVASIAFAWMVPAATKRAHVRRQNRMLDRCRALYVVALQVIELSDEDGAHACLARIQRIEARWRYGGSPLFRLVLALWSIGLAAVGYTVLRALSLLPMEHRTPTLEDLRRFTESAPIVLMIGAAGSLHALNSYLGAWTDWRLVDDCGDRPERILNAGRDIAMAPKTSRRRSHVGDLSTEQMFGLGSDFTRRQLDAARRKLVRKLHPDLWQHASPAVRRSQEEALKRVNAAYDQLRAAVT